MLFSDRYSEPLNESQASLREKGSKFIAFVFPVKEEAEIKKHLLLLKGKYPDATHHCFAWILHPDKSAQRSSDDGEPAGSAGKPILRAILSSNLTNILVVVVRYFGGTQLGIPGLIQAYGTAAKQAIDICEKAENYVQETFEISCAFEHENEIHRILQQFTVKIQDCKYSENVTYIVSVRKSEAEKFQQKVKDNYLLEMKIKLLN